ncbi:aminotransferase-like domain-containing protein [Vibrio sp. WJH972]
MEIAQSVQGIKPSYIREILAAASDTNVISLAGGLPDEQTFPLELMKPTIDSLLSTPSVFQYGGTVGYPPLLDHLHQRYELPESHSVMTTTGSQQGLDLIARAYINPGDTIAMEAPCYLGAMQVFNLACANLVTVSQEKDGPNINQLEECFRSEQPKLFYSVPDFHNPTGVCWSLQKRHAVANLCMQYNVTLIEDAPYRELRFSGETLPMVSDLCPLLSIVLRSFSKIASPGLRVGSISTTKEYLVPIIKVKQGADLHSSVPPQAMLLGLLKHPHYSLHLESIRHQYKEKRDALVNALEQHLPEQCEIYAPQGGMFVWVTLPPCDPFEFARTMLEQHIAIVPSPVFYPDSYNADPAIRLNYTNASSEELNTAVQRVAETLKLRYC